MGLITKEVEVKINPNNIGRFEARGYNIPKSLNKNNKLTPNWGGKIIVKTEDLSECSHQPVDVSCDGCNKEYIMPYSSYTKYRRGDNIYCKKCSKKIFYSGKNSPNYKFDKTEEEREIERNYLEYKEFTKRVLARDNYTCQCCRQHGNCDMEVHHLDGYNWCVEKRTDDTNGITLCFSCHGNFHSVYGKKDNTKEQYMEWLKIAELELEKYDGVLPVSRQVYCIEEEKIYTDAQSFALEKGVSAPYVYKTCNKNMRSKKIKEHFMWYDDYLLYSKKDIEEYIKWNDAPIDWSKRSKTEPYNCKKVVCLNTREIFTSITRGAKEKGLNSHKGIVECCNHRALTAGIDESTGESCVWRYLEEYEKMSENEIESALDIIKMFKHGEGRTGKYCPNSKKVICLTTSKIFDSITEAKKYYNARKISECCNGKRNYSGKLPDGTPLQWMYYEDFLKFPIEEQNKILKKNVESSDDGSFLLH